MGEIVVGEIGKMVVRPQRRLLTELAASGLAVALAAAALSVLKQEPSEPAPFVLPIVDQATGKILDRFGENRPAEQNAAPRPVSSVALFAPGVDLGPELTVLVAVAGSPVVAAPPIRIAERNETSRPIEAAGQNTPVAAARAEPRSRATPARPAAGKRVLVAELAPLPPPRPEGLDDGKAATSAPAAAADVSGQERPSFFGWSFPSEIVPTGRKVLKRVASLSGAMLDRLTP